eukprot:TRINITY_DN65645_c0_g1_i1.p1 TRINITY_DN65645_c0_g1~~TRINITY_DN65645_c0_g1_i1.p1  ORF type:complete len:155 (+),score=27.26 TRINITY_DN65645_c0_g1_i1:158-622(+)
MCIRDRISSAPILAISSGASSYFKSSIKSTQRKMPILIMISPRSFSACMCWSKPTARDEFRSKSSNEMKRARLTSSCSWDASRCAQSITAASAASTSPVSTKSSTTFLRSNSVSYTHLRAHETPEHLVCRLLLEKKKKNRVGMEMRYLVWKRED